MLAGIILAAGRGTRLKSYDKNKVALPFLNKPLVTYAVELMRKITPIVVVVIGAFHESVKQLLEKEKVIFAYQKKRLGTGHATKIGFQTLEKLSQSISLVLVGYGDHTMFYKKFTIEKLIELHKSTQAAMSLITAEFDQPEKLKWGRILRNKQGDIIESIEEKDASAE